jgi:para-nitrobenzyl esterase
MWLGALGAAMSFGGVSMCLAQSNPNPTAMTQSGQVRGALEHGINVFRGIPYGAPTGGANRFRPPKPPASWSGTRDATAFGDRCPQIAAPTIAAWSSWTEPVHQSEDCLVLNIWTPGLGAGKRPVMVWLHGGGFSVGSGSSVVYDGGRLAKRGDVVVVTLNHRLNLFGYLYLAGIGGPSYADSGNLGQLDLVAALAWVRDNISRFGGDPGQVTVFGESGGGGKVGTLMAMPAAHGLFQRAIMESGFAVTAIPAADASSFTARLLKALHLGPKQIDRLRTLSVERLLAALQEITQGSPLALGPVVDGQTLLRHPFTPDAPALSADVPLLVGYNRDETTVLFPPPGAFELNWASLREKLQATISSGKDVSPLIEGFHALRPNATPSDLYFTITTERTMGANAHTVAQRRSQIHRAPVYLYRLEWTTPVEEGRLRSPHSLDVPMVFDNVAASSSLIGSGAAEAQRVADAMSSAWIAFAHTGSPHAPGLPSWPPFDTEHRATMIFNVISRAVDDPLSRERALLAPYAGLRNP